MSPAPPTLDSEFEQRTRALLTDSVDALPAAVRSRLTQARYAALAAGRPGTRAVPVWASRRWAVPAGVFAAAVLAVFVAVVPHGTTQPATATASASEFDDVELLADGDAVPMVQDASSTQGADYDFYEWAVNEAGTGAPGDANAAGT